MADVTVISSSIVRPQNTNQSSRTKIHLTPFDLNTLYLDYTPRGLLFHKPDPETRFISRLKTSLSTALEIYFPFAGRLVKVDNLEDNTVSFYIDCDDSSGVKFVHAESKSLSVSDILQPHGYVPDFLDHFFQFSNVQNCDGVSKPLLAIQVTEMNDGVFIGLCTNHLVADGISVWSFLHAWSKICSSGSVSDLHPLVLKGWFLDGIDYPIHIPVSEMETPPPPSRELSSMVITKERIFHFTKKNISDLKAKANNEVGTTDVIISSLQAVSAHMWRSVIRNSGLSREGETHCKVGVDLRQRLNPPLEKECFGNVAYFPPATVTVGDLLDRGQGWAALQINKLVRSQTNESCKTFAEDWARNVKILKPQSRVVGNTIIISSSPRFGVYNTDFGWGKPIAVRAGMSHGTSGKLAFMRGIEEGTFDVQATLWSGDVLVKLLADLEFLENVTIV
ncbi:putative acetyltransferase [Cardamine amara subsp. amara]|uniref:Acetyltransferase n=1 Tax=Cardamine amara subsp. amara TaxID=228776 RepID=A0ABD1BBR9_CARAN